MSWESIDATRVALIKYETPDQNYYDQLISRLDRQYGRARIEVDSTQATLLVAFDGFDESILYKDVSNVRFDFSFELGTEGKPFANVGSLKSSFDEKTVTYNLAPETRFYFASATVNPANPDPTGTYRLASANLGVEGLDMYYKEAFAALRNGAKITITGANTRCFFWLPDQSSRIRFYMQLGNDVGVNLTSLSPRYGTFPKIRPVTFSWDWYVTDTVHTLVTVEQASAVVRWRESEGAEVHEIAVTTDKSVTLPAGSFSSDSIQWQVSVTANSGVVSTSNWYTIKTADTFPTATPVSPANEVQDGTKPTIFVWTHTVSTGTEQAGADLQISTDGETWAELAHVDGAMRTYTAEAGSFSAGTRYWRVRTYNSEGAAGVWSEAAEFVVLAASPAPMVAATAEPHTLVTWQAEGQQAFQVRIGGYDSGSVFGTEKRFQYPEFLPDGTHTVAVRVQNKYGLWSVWGETAIEVENAAGPEFALTAGAADVTMLSWPDPGYSRHLIYRDGAKIGETAGNSFTDQYAGNGTHSYAVRGVYADSGNYFLTAEATVTVRVKDLMLRDVEGGEWVRVPHTVKDRNGTSQTVRRNVTYINYSGAALPDAEIGREKSRVYHIDPVFLFTETENAEKFAAMLGRVVCLKDPYGVVLFGVLDGWEARENRYNRRFSAALTEIEYDEAESNG